MRVLVPYAENEPKTRLSSLLSPDERREFSRVMLDDVLAAIRETGHDPVVLAPENCSLEAPVIADERPLSAAVNAHLEPDTAVVMADLALATPAGLAELFDADGDVVIAPGIGGGTNALVSRHPAFTVDYHGASFRDHRTVAAEVGATLTVVDSFRLAIDVDEASDLADLLIHGTGATREWLIDAGVTLDAGTGRAGVCRE